MVNGYSDWVTVQVPHGNHLAMIRIRIAKLTRLDIKCTLAINVVNSRFVFTFQQTPTPAPLFAVLSS
jgi:hypothetical protein